MDKRCIIFLEKKLDNAKPLVSVIDIVRTRTEVKVILAKIHAGEWVDNS